MMKRTVLAILLTAAAVSFAKADSVLNIKKSLTDNHIVVPETYDTGYEKMMQAWWENGYLEMERQNAGKVVEVSDEVLADRLSKMPTTIEMPYNQVVGQWIRMYLKRQSMVENMLGLSLYYMPIFERALESRGMPLELKYLPVIESAMNPVAVSPAGAAGLWQFMPATGRGVGLEISSLVDERLDPIKSSEKAADYLKTLYGMYNDWSLAIAAYNCGPGNVNKALRRAGGRRGNDFWSIYRYLPSETRGYVPAFIAANYVMTYYNRHGISPTLAKRPLITDTIHVNNRVHFQQIAEVLDIPVSEIKLLNPQYRRNEIPGDIKSYALTLPSKQILAYIMFEDSILNHRAEEFTRRRIVEPGETSARQGDDSSKDYIVETTTKQVTTHYTVHRKESLSSIAHKFGVKSSDIQRWNGLSSSRVKRGQRLKIVTTKKVTVRRQKPKASSPGDDETEVDDSPTDTDTDAVPNPQSASASIGAKSGIPGESVGGSVPAPPTKAQKPAPASVPGPRSHSSGNSSKNEVPAPHKQPSASKKTAPQAAESYEVQAGDRLEWIAKKNGVSVEEIKKANNMTDDKIIAGKALVIPSKAKASTRSSRTEKASAKNVKADKKTSSRRDKRGSANSKTNKKSKAKSKADKSTKSSKSSKSAKTDKKSTAKKSSKSSSSKTSKSAAKSGKGKKK